MTQASSPPFSFPPNALAGRPHMTVLDQLCPPEPTYPPEPTWKYENEAHLTWQPKVFSRRQMLGHDSRCRCIAHHLKAPSPDTSGSWTIFLALPADVVAPGSRTSLSNRKCQKVVVGQSAWRRRMLPAKGQDSYVIVSEQIKMVISKTHVTGSNKGRIGTVVHSMGISQQVGESRSELEQAV